MLAKWMRRALKYKQHYSRQSEVEVNSPGKQRCRMMGRRETSEMIKQGKRKFTAGICSVGNKY